MLRVTAETGENGSAALPVIGVAAPAPAWGVVAAAVLGALLPQTWFRAGAFLAAGDTFPQLEGLRGVTRLWGTEFTGTGSTGFPAAQLLERGLLDGVTGLGGSPELAQRLWFTVVMAVCAASVAWMAMAFTRRSVAVFAAGAVAVLNPFLIITIPNLQPVIALACMALLVGIAVRLANGEHVAALVGVALSAWAAELARTPPLLAHLATVAAIAMVALVFVGEWRSVVRVGGAMLAGAAFWLVPLLLHHFTGSPGIHPVPDAASTANEWATVHGGPSNVLTLVASWGWGDAQLVGEDVARLARFPWSLMRWALPVAALVSVVTAWDRRVSKVLAVAIPVLVVLGAGSNPPFLPVYEFFRDIVPGYEMFRQPMSKFGVMIVVGLALAVSIGVDESLRRWSARASTPDDAQPLIPLAILLGVGLVFVHPLYLGTVVPGDRATLPSARVLLPDSWPEAGAAIDALPGEGATLVLPLSDSFHRGTTWGFYGIDDLVPRLTERPAYQLLPKGYQEADGSSPALMREAESALANGDADTLSGAMRALGTAYLAVRLDTTTRFGSQHEFRDGESLVGAARRMGLQSVGTFEHVELFVLPSVSRFGVATNTVSITPNGRTDVREGLAVASSLLDDHTVITEQGSVGTSWVPAPGESGLSVRLDAGDYLTRVVSRGPAMWRANVSGRKVRLVPADRAEVNGVSLLDPTPVELTANRAPFALLVGNDPGATAEPLVVPLDDDTDVQLVAGAPVSLLTLAPSILDLADAPARFCARADAPPSIDVPPGVGSSATPTSDSVALRTTAGVVCVSSVVRLPAPVQGHRRWVLSFDFATNADGAPSVCMYSSERQKCLAGSRLNPAGTRGSVRSLIDATGELGDVELVLGAAAAGTTAAESTEVTFSRVSLSPLQESGGSVNVPAPIATPPVTTVEPNGLPIVVGISNAVGDLVGQLSTEATDCDRYDDEPARIDAQPGDEDGSLLVEADRHSACVSAPIDAPAGVRSVVATFEYQTDNEGVARIELRDAVTNAVITSRWLAASTFWTSEEVRFDLPAAAINRDESLQLVFVVQGPRAGEPARTVDASFRRLRLLPTQPFAFALTPVGAPARQGTEVSEIDDRFVSLRSDGDVVLTFQQAWSPAWRLDGLPAGATAEHVKVNGWANGWMIRGLDGRAVVLEVTYRYESVVAFAVWSVLVVWVVALLCADWALIVRRRRRASVVPRASSFDGPPATSTPIDRVRP